MTVSVDALNVATIHLLPKLENLFFDEHMFLKKVLESGIDRRQSGGEYAAFDVVVDGPGQITQLVSGGEAYSYGRKNITKQARVYIPTMIYSFAVEGETLRHSSGPTGIENLLKLYPEQANLDFRQKVVAQALTGNGASNGTGGITTLNGDETYNPDGTALNGLFDFAAKASQTDTVQNLVKEGGTSGVTGWYNQYGNVTSFTTNGKDTMRDVYNKCRIRGDSYGFPSLGFTDATSWNNYYASLDDQVRFTSSVKGEDGRTIDEGLMFQGLTLFNDPSLDDNSASFGHTTAGTMYFVNPKTFFMLTLGADAQKETKGFFDMRGPFKLEGRDAWGWEIVLAMQPACRYLKANGALEGTALP